jgi:two-component system, sensor histidine kinase
LTDSPESKPPASAPLFDGTGTDRRPSDGPLYDQPLYDQPPCDILVVDDKPENLLAVRVALGELEYHLVEAQSGREALRQLLQRDFALILLDVQMPGMSGLETARLIRSRERSKHVPIIFITAFGPDEAEVREAYQLGAVDFLMKPFQPEILRAKASVFVELERRTEQVRRQAEQIRAHVLQERESALAEQRSRLESEALKQRLEEQRQHAAELEGLNRRLAEDDRRKDEFIALLGHELRNPLAPLVTGLELLASSEGEVATKTRQVMRRQIEHLIRLVDDLLDLSRVSRGKVELRRARVRAGDVLEHALSLSRPLIEDRKHRLQVDRTGAETPLQGDEVRLTQVLANLLNNAARYTDPGGCLEVACGVRSGGVEFVVKDNGRGISPQMLPRVFDLFMQEREGGGGLGIGLTLVKQLVQMHGGRVMAKSAGAGQGSEFSVWLPALQLAQGRSAADEVAEAVPSTQPDQSAQAALSVMLVEDNEDVRALMGELLSSWGHEVRQANTGEGGVDLILKQHPDIAFVDIGLPDMDGYELARRVRARLGGTPLQLVALSGFGQRGDRERALGAGFDHHIAKPASPADLQRLLQEAEAKRNLRGRSLANVQSGAQARARG